MAKADAYALEVNALAHPWSERTAAAREVILRHGGQPDARRVVDDVDRALAQAVIDDGRMQVALADLDAARSTAELKAALRRRPDPMSADTPTILAMRQRHEAIASVRNRLDELRRHVERMLVDLDTMVAQLVATAVAAGGSEAELAAQIQRVTDDAAALAAAHEEIEHL